MVDRYPYSRSFRVRAFECDPFGELRLSMIQKYAQEVATGHLEELGLAHGRLAGEGVVFVMISAATRIVTRPRAGQKIVVYTCPAPTHKARFYREVVICDEEGCLLAECQTVWVVVDPVSHRVLRPGAFRHELPVLEGYQPFCDPQKHPFPQGLAATQSREVRLSDIDRNLHLNNTVYIDIALDAFGDQLMGAKIREFYLKFRNEAKLGDQIALATLQQEAVFTVIGTVGGAPCFDAQILTAGDLQ